MLEHFPSYPNNQGENLSSIFDEHSQIQFNNNNKKKENKESINVHTESGNEL